MFLPLNWDDEHDGLEGKSLRPRGWPSGQARSRGPPDGGTAGLTQVDKCHQSPAFVLPCPKCMGCCHPSLRAGGEGPGLLRPPAMRVLQEVRAEGLCPAGVQTQISPGSPAAGRGWMACQSPCHGKQPSQEAGGSRDSSEQRGGRRRSDVTNLEM